MGFSVGWLDDLTNWLGEQLGEFFDALGEMLTDFIVVVVEAVFELVLLVIDALSLLVPDALQGFSICGVLASAGPTVQWAVTSMRVPEGMAIIAACFVFRMLRKLFTLGQW